MKLLCVLIAGAALGAEVYGSAALCAKLWPKLLTSAATDALAEFDDKKKFEPATAKTVEARLSEAAKGPAKDVEFTATDDQRGRNLAQAANAQPGQSGNRITQQQSQAPPPQTATPPVAPPPETPMSAPRVRIVRYDTVKTLLVECQDKEKPGLVIHRSYIAK